MTTTTFFGYLEAPYLAGPYLASHGQGADGWQFTAATTSSTAFQFYALSYNTTQLRVMCDFPSRGIPSLNGLNWTANSTATSGTNEFTVNNMNTDIVEQVWRSATGVDSGLILDCDTGFVQGVLIDTFAALGTNLTTGATVQLIGSNNSGHAPAGVTIPLTVEKNGDMVYIAPLLPSIGYRYWRILIDDPTNPDTFCEVGTIVFGPAIIFQPSGCFIDQVVKTPTNYVDEVFTEGFANVKNDRGIKNSIKLDFRNIEWNTTDFQNLKNVFETSRTILKCLWIPTPEFPTRFMTFGKLKRIPQERHNVKGPLHDFVNFTVEVDESS